MPTKRRWTLNYYITQCTGNSISWGSDELEIRCCWESQHPAEGAPRPRLISLEIRPVDEKMLDWGTCSREAGPQAPVWATQGNGKETLMAIRVGVNMLQFCSVPNSLSHTALSIKWEVFFLRTVSLVIIVSSLCSACMCRCICIMCLYNWSPRPTIQTHDTMWLYNNSLY